MHTSTSRPRSLKRLAAPAAVAALVSASFLALPNAAFAAEDEHGGASRLGDVDQTEAIRAAIQDGPAKNVILIIGDGMGDSEITVARNYAEGASGKFEGIDSLPLTGQYTTYAVTEDGGPNYASESASTASAWSTGTKTVNGKLSVDRSNAPQNTLLEIARANGMRTGNVSTAEIQDATPAAQYSHISKRGCYGPDEASADCSDEALENGGLGSITEQLLTTRPDVTLGGGAETFGQKAKAGKWEGQTLFEQAEDRGFQLVRDAEGLAGVNAANADSPVIGVFSDGNFPTRYVGPEATVGGGALPAQSCTANPERLSEDLSLGALTNKAIGLLDNQDGFFLQVEGASIDKRNHAADACGQIGETVDLDEATQAAMEYAAGRDDTLVIVTADHAHTSQIVGSVPPGLSANLLTSEGREMIVSYGTGPLGESQQHTGAQVRVAGYGPGAANVIGLTDQTDIFFTSSRTAEMDRDIVAQSANATIEAERTDVVPGSTFNVRVEDLRGDWQAIYETARDSAPQPASAAIEGGLIDPTIEDVLRGVAEFEVTAPDEAGPFTVTVTGVQTSKELTVQLNADPNASPAPSGSPSAPAPNSPAPDPSDPASPSPSETAGAGVIPGGGGGGMLPITGQVAPWLLALIGVLALVGGRIMSRHTRRTLA